MLALRASEEEEEEAAHQVHWADELRASRALFALLHRRPLQEPAAERSHVHHRLHSKESSPLGEEVAPVAPDWPLEEVPAVLPVAKVPVQYRIGPPAGAGVPSIAQDRPSPHQQISLFLFRP